MAVGGNIYATSLNGVAGNAQNLSFNNAAAINVAGAIGAAAPFALINFATGNKVTFAAGLTAGQTLNFAVTNEVEVNNDLAGTNITTDAVGGVHSANNTLTVGANQNFTGNIGTAANPFGTVNVGGAHSVTIGTAEFHAGIKGANATAIFNHAGSSALFLGENGENIARANFATKGNVLGEVHSTVVDVQAGATATFDGVVFEGNTANLRGAGATITFTSAVQMNMLIGGDGIVDFNENGGAILRNIGEEAARVAGVNIFGGAHISGEIHSNAINVAVGIELINDTTFNGVTNFTDSKISLGERDLTLMGGATRITGASTMFTAFTAIDGVKAGNLVSGPSGNIIVDGASNLEIDIDETHATVGPEDELKLIAVDGGGTTQLDLARITVVGNNRFSTWVKAINPARELILTRISRAGDQLDEDRKEVPNDIDDEQVDSIEEAAKNPKTPGGKVANDIGLQKTADERVDAANRILQTNNEEVTQTTLADVEKMTSAVSDHISNLVSSGVTFASLPSFTSTSFTPTSFAAPTVPVVTAPTAVRSEINIPAPTAARGAISTPTAATIRSDVTGGGASTTGGTAATPATRATESAAPAASGGGKTAPAAASGGSKSTPAEGGTSRDTTTKPDAEKSTPTDTEQKSTGKKAPAKKVSEGNPYVTGISSGEAEVRHGLWATPFYSHNSQKKRGKMTGSNSSSFGGTIGVDTKANEQTTVGLALSAMNTAVKHKDAKSGDKTKIDSYLLSAYSAYQFGNNFFGQGVFSIGSSNVENKENRKVGAGYNIAEGKYSAMIFAAEAQGGYNHLLNDRLVVTPTVGLGYTRINGVSYTESGAANTPLMDITSRASQKLDAIGGIRLTILPFMANDVAITPAIHASVRHDLIGKAAKVSATMAGFTPPSQKAKLQKTYVNLGANLGIAYGMMNYGASFESSLAEKYVGMQGSLMVRVNF